MTRSLRCRLGRHRWRSVRNDSGGLHLECRDCGEFRDVPEPPPDSLTSG